VPALVVTCSVPGYTAATAACSVPDDT
jgi:hypothetical protein